MIDFTDISKINSFRAYGGANGIKKGILFNGKPYMLKISNRKNDIYTNSVISEYLCSKIFNILEFDTQEVILGKIFDNNKEKLCVACKDFKQKGEYLYEFLTIKNSFTSENSNGSGTELSEILSAIEQQNFCDSKEVLEFFWDMFIVDAYLGNFDRHNGNWGFLVNEEKNTKRIAPIYDCGSCLYPQATDENLKEFLEDEKEIEKRIYIFPNSAIKENGEKINLYNFLKSTKNNECINSLNKITLRISKKENEINNLIDTLPISDVRKHFYKYILHKRYEKLLLNNLKHKES